MATVIVKENETLDSALRRFKRNCAKAGIQQEIRKREHYEKPRASFRIINFRHSSQLTQWAAHCTIFCSRSICVSRELAAVTYR